MTGVQTCAFRSRAQRLRDADASRGGSWTGARVPAGAETEPRARPGPGPDEAGATFPRRGVQAAQPYSPHHTHPSSLLTHTQVQSIHDELVRQLAHLRSGAASGGGRHRGTDVPFPAQAQTQAQMQARGAGGGAPRRDAFPHRYLKHNRYFFDG